VATPFPRAARFGTVLAIPGQRIPRSDQEYAMKFEALMLRVLSAGSLLVCIFAFGAMLLTGAPRMPAGTAPTINAIAGSPQCTAPVRVLPGQVAFAQQDQG
jgi:hypothetical protein